MCAMAATLIGPPVSLRIVVVDLGDVEAKLVETEGEIDLCRTGVVVPETSLLTLKSFSEPDLLREDLLSLEMALLSECDTSDSFGD